MGKRFVILSSWAAEAVPYLKAQPDISVVTWSDDHVTVEAESKEVARAFLEAVQGITGFTFSTIPFLITEGGV